LVTRAGRLAFRCWCAGHWCAGNLRNGRWYRRRRNGCCLRSVLGRSGGGRGVGLRFLSGLFHGVSRRGRGRSLLWNRGHGALSGNRWRGGPVFRRRSSGRDCAQNCRTHRYAVVKLTLGNLGASRRHGRDVRHRRMLWMNRCRGRLRLGRRWQHILPGGRDAGRRQLPDWCNRGRRCGWFGYLHRPRRCIVVLSRKCAARWRRRWRRESRCNTGLFCLPRRWHTGGFLGVQNMRALLLSRRLGYRQLRCRRPGLWRRRRGRQARPSAGGRCRH